MWKKEVSCCEEGFEGHEMRASFPGEVEVRDRHLAWSSFRAVTWFGQCRTTMEHEIIRIPSVGQSGREQLSQQCYAVRIDVFHREQGFPLDTEIDKFCLFYSILAVK